MTHAIKLAHTTLKYIYKCFQIIIPNGCDTEGFYAYINKRGIILYLKVTITHQILSI